MELDPPRQQTAPWDARISCHLFNSAFTSESTGPTIFAEGSLSDFIFFTPPVVAWLVSKATDKRFVEMEKRAEECHLQSMASKEKPSIEVPLASVNPGNPRSKNGVVDEAQ
ncbi:hypothetical protein DY000_02022252 [Brassica cretica]|uniref:Uncharacterized protein n=1 Tax=Brassica cretica TaxID=69181 RepID=A0ABQ7EK60_BRACR|nr:hypothetical protein DY000_02022252 [Brassica cretica]